jgi:tuftelin-interacting protein 11
VLPKLLRAVDDWQPATDRVPLHVWLLPWLPDLGDHLQVGAFHY